MSLRAEPSGEQGERPAGWWLDAVRRYERRGELLGAFDLAERGLEQHPHDLSLKHRAVLALARAGATEQAAARFEQFGLDGIADEEIAALRARIAKDVALAADGAQRSVLAAEAAERYSAIFERTGGYYPAVNAATLSLLAGEERRARQLAARVLALLEDSQERSYYAAATRGEAHLLLGDYESTRGDLADAAALNDGDYGALATTRRQLRMICNVLGVDHELLSALAGPAVVHFCGHLIAQGGAAGRFPHQSEAQAAGAIHEVVNDQQARFGYGSLAGGADILWAEALLASGCELHVVLPFALDEFLERSVRPSGEGWIERFERCLSAAVAVDYATNDAFLGDDVLFRYCSELAMGLALLRARYLGADIRQLALWDGGPADGAAGTAIDVATWTRRGRAAVILSPSGERLAPPAPASTWPSDAPADPALAALEIERHGGDTSSRVVRAMLFADVKGFSKLTDEQLPVFAHEVLGAFAEALNRHRDHVWHRNTWGDAVYAVLSDAGVAAACALDLQDAIGSIDLTAHGLPSTLALRLGGHVGPVFPTHDPVLEALGFMGSHVSRTARIEPVTPPGAVYVTEPFAAALVLDDDGRFVCDYVGRMPAAKGYGVLRMYRLRRRHSGDSRG